MTYKKRFIKNIFEAPILLDKLQKREYKNNVDLLALMAQALIGASSFSVEMPGQALAGLTRKSYIIIPENIMNVYYIMLDSSSFSKLDVPIVTTIIKIFLDCDAFFIPKIPAKWGIDVDAKVKGKKHVFVSPYWFSAKKEYADEFTNFLNKYKFLR